MKTSSSFLTVVAFLGMAFAANSWGQGLENELNTQPLPDPVVKAIDVQYAGPVTLSKERILSNMRTKVGSPYSASAVEEDIRSLYATGAIANVRIYEGGFDKDGVRLIVLVGPKATVSKVTFQGVSQVKVSTLEKKISTKVKQAATEAVLEEDRQKILEIYRDKGYRDTGVKYRLISDEKSNTAAVVFEVSEAGKTIVRDINFEGNKVYKSSQLRKVIKTRTHNMLSFLTKAGLLETEQVSEDIEAIRLFYVNNGYLDAHVKEAQIAREDGAEKVAVTFRITEGPQYHVGKVAITGNRLFPTETLAKTLKEQPGAVYSPKTIGEDIKAMQDLYGARGYIDLQVIPESTSGGTTVNNLLYRIEEGRPSTLDRINITGNVLTKDKIIRRELAVAPGETYNSVRVEASKARLQNLNYFDRVELFPSDTLSSGKKDLNVVVQEKRTGSLNFGVGFSTIDSLLGFVELSQSNFDIGNWPHFTGGGQRLRIRLQGGTERKDAVITFTEPYFLDYKLAVGTELYYHDANYLSTMYAQRNYGGNFFARKAINEWTSVRLDYRAEEIELYDMDHGLHREEKRALRPDMGMHTRSQITPSLSFDTRDSIFLTRQGTRVELSTYVSGLGGDVEDYGVDLEASQYFHLPWDTILIFNAEVATVQGFGKDNYVPIFDRLFLGGSNNLRGFRYRYVSPQVGKESFGGKSLGRATAEYTFPVVDRVRGAVFYDAGFVNADAGDFSVDNYASDVGIGVRLDLPIGPVRLDYAIPTEKGNAKGGKNGQFNFNMGYQF